MNTKHLNAGELMLLQSAVNACFACDSLEDHGHSFTESQSRLQIAIVRFLVDEGVLQKDGDVDTIGPIGNDEFDAWLENENPYY